MALISAYAKTFSPAKKIYITLNTLLHDRELPEAFRMLSLLEEHRVDGIIVQDLGVARVIRAHFPSLPLHASTQMAAHNLDSVRQLEDLGFTRIVLARELSLSEIGQIVQNCQAEIEVFIHGALCYSYSGLCLFSAMTSGRSGNRGRCAYCCRHIFASDRGKGHPFSMKDMALLPVLDKVVATGARSLKIEGRMKSPLYVACVTSAYRRKLDGMLSADEERLAVEEIQTIFSRPWTRLYSDSPAVATSELIDPHTVGHRGARIGKAGAVFRDGDRQKRVRFTTSRPLEKYDGLQIDLPGEARPFGFSIRRMRRHGDKRDSFSVPAGTDVEIEISGDAPHRIPPGAPIYCASSQEVQKKYGVVLPRSSELAAGIPVDISVNVRRDRLKMEAVSPVTGDRAETCSEQELESARTPRQTAEAIRKACTRLGDTEWMPRKITVEDDSGLYVPPALLNQARRELIRQLDRQRQHRLEIGIERYKESLEPMRDVKHASNPVPLYSLKIHLSSQLPSPEVVAQCSRLIVEIDAEECSSLPDKLEHLRNKLPVQEILPALPLIIRADQRTPLLKNIDSLVRQGYIAWEVPGLAGVKMLADRGLQPVSADWTLYAFNREASACLRELGIASHVTSPEQDLDSLYQTDGRTCEPELLLYQHTPLYISATPPMVEESGCGGSVRMKGEDGAELTAWQRGQEWVTTAADPLDNRSIAERALSRGIRRFRLDYSWSHTGR